MANHTSGNKSVPAPYKGVVPHATKQPYGKTIPPPPMAAAAQTVFGKPEISTDTTLGDGPVKGNKTTARSPSPTAPPISPITPPLASSRLPVMPDQTSLPPPADQPQQQKLQKLPPSASSAGPGAAQASAPTAGPVSFSANRQTFTHSEPPPDAAATAIPPPRPEPIDFDANPDVLALKSAISILQLQRQRATNDIRALSSAKEAAVQDPDAFIEQLMSGQVRGQSDPLFPSQGPSAAEGHKENDSDSESSSSSSSDEAEADGDTGKQDGTHEGQESQQLGESAEDDITKPWPKKKPKPQRKKENHDADQTKMWKNLPRPQNVVRCPPINWSQYAVVGESLDKLHADQVSRPAQGHPAVMAPGGSFEFRAGGDETPREFVGVAAPYTPGRDKLDKKPRGGRR